MFTRSGSLLADPPFPRDIRDCLYTWRERRLMLAKVQHAPEWMATRRGFPAYEELVEVFIDGGDERVVEEPRVKPVDVADIAALYERSSKVRWAFAICALTFVRHSNAEPAEAVAGSPIPGSAVWAAVAHAVAVFDLKHRRLAGVCFVRELDEQPLVPFILAAEKLLHAFRTDLATVHVVAPVIWHDELEFLPWLLYAMRAPEVAGAISNAKAVPTTLRLAPEELLFWGLPSNFENLSDRTAVFPKPDLESDRILVGLNLALRVDGRDVDVNLRFCESGVEKGHPPHLDIQISDKTNKRGKLHLVKLAEHVPVDLARFASYGLQYHLLAYVALRPNVSFAAMIGASETEQSIGLHLSMVRDPLYQESAREVLDFEPHVFERMVNLFNVIYRVDLAASRALEQEISATTEARWRNAADDRRPLVLRAALRLWRTRLVSAQAAAGQATVNDAHAQFIRDGRAALATFEAEVAHHYGAT